MARPVGTQLTPRQQEIVAAIFQIGQGGGVLVADLVKKLKSARETSLVPTLERIERAGYIEILGGGQKGRPRLLELTNRAKAELGLRPGIAKLGVVAAGTPGGCVIEEQEYIQCSAHPHGQDYSYIEVSGDSMDREGVLDGDTVHCEKRVPREKEIVIAQITRNGSCQFALKYYHRCPQTRHIILVPHSSNRAHRVLLLAPECDAADYVYIRRVAKEHRPVVTKRDIECLPVEDVEVNWVWTRGLIRPYNPGRRFR
jgi:SOS-response transcriptional repressor LexA